MQYKIYQVDAFTDKAFGGNPAAIIPLESWLSDAEMQAIALENNLSETAFFVKETEQYGLRWFTPATEVDLCGHATLASAHVLFKHLHYPSTTIQFSTKSGILTVQQDVNGYIMDFPTDIPQAVPKPAYLESALGTEVQAFYRGRDDFMAVISDQTTLLSLKPDFRQISKLDARGLIVTTSGEKIDFVSRCFFPQAGIDEDPVTGSAHTLLTPYWAKRLGKNKLSAQQLSSRGGDLECVLEGERVQLHGQAVTYMEGIIQLRFRTPLQKL